MTGFKYKGMWIDMQNYQDVFGACSMDIRDEVRSAVLDGTQIGEYIDLCLKDDYKLGQIRKALRENCHYDNLYKRLSGRAIYLLRLCNQRKVGIDPLLCYVKDNGVVLVSMSTFESLAELILVGVDITKVDFRCISENQVPVFCKGLLRGYPMWLLLNDGCCRLHKDTVEALMRGMKLGIDVHVFLDGSWSVKVLILLFSYANQLSINEVLTLINEKFDYQSVSEILKLLANGVDVTRLCSKDKDGYPIYNAYQMHEIGKAIKLGVVMDEMYNPYLSDKMISDMIEEKI